MAAERTEVSADSSNDTLSTISSTVGIVGAGAAITGAVMGSFPMMGAAAAMGVAALVAREFTGRHEAPDERSHNTPVRNS